ncbi:uncharacterized protein LOC108332471 isoform X2 [Vigna angularis]|uniref:uncharacterized protein LOC108332471 isoform X2 n=1 Tax=Phaseolus angularis TaxID=3914 RepID=UPI00080A685B|nr:uncharacterized protein LOC108332471 isoform X2 [Vigna angularis]
MTENRAYRNLLIEFHPKIFVKRNNEYLTLLLRGRFGRSVVGRITIFLLKVAALEIIRRFSKSRCPCVWRGLQALQILCYSPFKWIQRWAPFKGLVDNMQVLSRPLLALSIATLFSDQSIATLFSMKSKCSDRKSDCSSEEAAVYSELSPLQVDLNISQCLTNHNNLESEKWLTQLNQELENQGLSLPEREEQKMWTKLVFWHGCDVERRPCLIVRLGSACNTLEWEDRPRFAQAVISQVEYGVLHLVDADNPQITVLVDCDGLSPVRIPMQMTRSCSSLLLDHFPNRLGCMFVIRLPTSAHVIAQSFIQDLKPATRNKMKIEGEMFQKVLAEYLPTLPSYLGGSCTCVKCYTVGSSRRDRVENTSDSDNEDPPMLHPSNELEGGLYGQYNQLLRAAIVGILIFWAFVALGAVVFETQ